ncbi:hypothetical protein ACS0TY_008463 [Phlomoides rotata]
MNSATKNWCKSDEPRQNTSQKIEGAHTFESLFEYSFLSEDFGGVCGSFILLRLLKPTESWK